MFKGSSFLDVLRQRAIELPDQIIYTFLSNGEEPGDSLTYAQLDQRARAIASRLQAEFAPGQRAILLFHPGIDYITALFGCMYAGVIAVPAYPPRLRHKVLDRTSQRITSMIDDAKPVVVLSHSGLQKQLKSCTEQVPELAVMRWLFVDQIGSEQAADYLHYDRASLDEVAYLQYTSGSTSTPKGVMVTHGNLLTQCQILRQSIGYTSRSISLIWLPPFHDWGLIEGIMMPAYNGHHAYLMDPVSFVNQPVRWLKAVTRWKVTHGGGPNFALDLCIRRVTPEEIRTLDLSSWTTLPVSAEPIRQETLEQFADTFAPCGFRREALIPAFGLAETTLQVSTSVSNGPTYVHADPSALALNRIVDSDGGGKATVLPCCGKPGWDTHVRIVDPDTREVCAENQVGEIWVSGGSVCAGYWNRQEETETNFRAFTSDTQEGPFLRTGDLGFLRNGELYFVGRRKDLIIVDGQNHYPQDIELTAERCCPILRKGAGAAFAIEVEGSEKVGLVYEVKLSARKAKLDMEAIAQEISQAITDHHGISLACLTLIRPGSIPKTSSGKIQRSASREAYRNGSLKTIGSWEAVFASRNSRKGHSATQMTHSPRVTANFGQQSLEQWIRQQVASRLGLPVEKISLQAPFSSLGIGSKDAIILAGEIERYLGRKLPATLLFDYPHIEALANWLSGSVAKDAGERDTTVARCYSEVGHAEPIAIVGMACRFPGASDPEAFWQVLLNGQDCITEVPTERWRLDDYFHPDPETPGKTYSKHGGFLSEIDAFDAKLFQISRPEAIDMDPQQRLLLEVSWEALERSGQAPDSLEGQKVGVFFGLSNSDYQRMQLMDTGQIGPYVASGGALSTAAGRLSYCLGLQGPALAVDTACSSSLMAVHLACQSIRSGESTMALAGGANLTLSPEVSVGLSKARMLSPSGRCHTFDAAADGYVRGEGCAVIVLKPLSAAIAEEDSILAVIRGSASNQDGRTNGLTAPSKVSQTAVIREAIVQAGVNPHEIQYVEAHGTGTALGDPIEIQALMDTVGQGRTRDHALYVGSVKTNIGHLEAAAGIAGLVKTVLSLQNRTIPKHLHFTQPNPYIDWNQLPIAVPTQSIAWPHGTSSPRMAGVSSFGFSGTNVHLILEEAPVTVQSTTETCSRPLKLLTLSAGSDHSLKCLADRYARFLETEQSVSLADFCHTANTRRAQLPYRRAIVGSTAEEISRQLLAVSQGVGRPVTPVQKRQDIAFLFAGQGEAYPGMGRQLYETEPVFKQTIDACDHLLQTFPAFAGRRSLRAGIMQKQGADDWFTDTAYVQPLLFAFHYALTELYRTWGIKPAAVSGHSVGEYAAACAAGVMDWPAGLRLVAERGQLMQTRAEPGRMAAILAETSQVEALITPYTDKLSVAAYNSSGNTVVAGDEEILTALCQRLSEQGIDSRFLRVSHAFHSGKMDAVMEPFEEAASRYSYAEPKLPLIQNVTGAAWANGEKPSASYWRDHLRQPVQFAAGIETLHKIQCEVFLEIGPTATLTHLVRQTFPGVTCTPSIRNGKDERRTLLEAAGMLFTRGVSIDWEGLAGKRAGRRMTLPTYPFDRERYWSPSVTTGKTDQRTRVEPGKAEQETRTDAIVPAVSSQTADNGNSENDKALIAIDWLKRIREAPLERRTEDLIDYLRGQIASLLMLPEEKLHPEQAVGTWGFDSLMAMHLRNRLQIDLEVNLPVASLLGEASLSSMAAACIREFGSSASKASNTEQKPIHPLPREEKSYALSTSQRQLWLLQEMDPTTPAYNLPTGLRLKGSLQEDILQRSLQELQNRHEILRVRIDTFDGEPRQWVQSPVPLPLPVVDLSHLPVQEAEEEAYRIAVEEASRPLNPSRDPLMQTRLIRLGEEDHILLLLFHHIVADGWSLVGIIMRELDRLYTAFEKGEDSPLPPLRIQYIDYAQWQQGRLDDEKLAPQLQYWKKQLDGAPFEPCFPADRQRQAFTKHLGKRVHAYLPKDLMHAVNALSRSLSVTPFVTLVAAMKALMYRWTGREDLIIGTTVSDRSTDELEHLVGDFTNHLPLRTVVSAEASARSLIEAVQRTVMNAFAHGDCPFEKIVKAVNPNRYGNRNPLYNVSVVMHTFSGRATSMKIGSALEASFIAPVAQIDNGTSELDLIFDLLETPKGLLIECEFDTELFETATIQRFIRSFETLLRGLVDHPACLVQDLPLLTAAEEQELVQASVADSVSYLPQECLHHLFEKQAQIRPDSVAVVCGDEQLSYSQLERLANQTAHQLRNWGVGPGAIVGICTERSLEMVVAILGILKTGAAYLALDPVYPTEHLADLLRDASASVIVAQEATRERASQLTGARVLYIDAGREPSPEEAMPLGVVIHPQDTAYVLYTSGSTGRPKGALITHYNVVRLFQATADWYQFTETDVWTLFHSYAFDFSVWELWGALLHGGKLVVVPYPVSRSPELFLDLLCDQRVTVLNQTPSAFRQLMYADGLRREPAPHTLRYVIFGGEPLDREQLVPWMSRYGLDSPQLVNMYGITETTVHVTYAPIRNISESLASPASVGIPIPDLQIYILDSNRRPVPLGAIGEICVGGAGVAQGYLNRPDLTEDRFIPNPFYDGKGERLYRSGDLGRILPDGTLEYIGRRDEQVKIRGFRIELGEIEAVLKQHPIVQDCVLQVWEPEQGDRRLVAYIVTPPDWTEADGFGGESAQEQVSQWQSVFDTTYDQGEHSGDPTLNITGWSSSYTGQPISREEMQAWVDHTVVQIARLKAKQILEIGCGTGMLLFRLAPACSRYTAVDLSDVALAYVRSQLEAVGLDESKVELLHRPADDLSGLQNHFYDVVVLNSIMQYLPSTDYFINVLRQAVQRVKPGGTIFVGDVRNASLLEAFHASVQFFRAKEDMQVSRIRSAVQRAVREENELLVEPEFFYALKREWPQIRNVEIRLKRGYEENELTRYRYDVLLHIEEECNDQDDSTRQPTSIPPACTRLDWQKDGLSLASLRKMLERDNPETLVVTGIPNRRLTGEFCVLEQVMHGDEEKTKAEVAALCSAEKEEGIHPEQLWAWEEELPYSVHVSGGLTANGLHTFDAVWSRHGVDEQTRLALLPAPQLKDQPLVSYGNDPIRGVLARQVMPLLHTHASERLPAHMVPSAFMLIDRLPLTANGKLDHRALPMPDIERPNTETVFVGPRNPIEERLADIACDILGIGQIGVHDNFFELGGNSLLATQFIGRVRDVFFIEVTLAELFTSPTIALFSERVAELLLEEVGSEVLEEIAMTE